MDPVDELLNEWRSLGHVPPSSPKKLRALRRALATKELLQIPSSRRMVVGERLRRRGQLTWKRWAESSSRVEPRSYPKGDPLHIDSHRIRAGLYNVDTRVGVFVIERHNRPDGELWWRLTWPDGHREKDFTLKAEALAFVCHTIAADDPNLRRATVI